MQLSRTGFGLVTLFVFVMLLTATVTAMAADVQVLALDPLANVVTSPPERANFTIEPVSDQPFTKAMRVETLLVPQQTYQIQISVRNVQPVEPGDRLTLIFYARGIATEAHDNAVQLGYAVEERRPPNKKVVLDTVTFPADGTWRRFEIPMTSGITLPPNEGQVAFRFGYFMQTVEVGGIELINHGK